ncbi:MAG: hypothetical protein OEM02_10230 [Desulfobulbaceae bacterium]|nr:hypothetical protein [Desulfobulbaceae bacterium]
MTLKITTPPPPKKEVRKKHPITPQINKRKNSDSRNDSRFWNGIETIKTSKAVSILFVATTPGFGTGLKPPATSVAAKGYHVAMTPGFGTGLK